MDSKINYSVYNRNNYLEIFERLRHRDGAAPSANLDQEEQYLREFMNEFMNDMRLLAKTDRVKFNEILGNVTSSVRGNTLLKEKMLELNKFLDQTGGNVENFYKQKYLKYKQKYTELKI